MQEYGFFVKKIDNSNYERERERERFPQEDKYSAEKYLA